MKDLKEDYTDFTKSDKFQWFMTILITLLILRILNYIPEPDFVELIKWSIFGLFGSEGLDQFTNIRK
ncbi:MAG TPA: hypothetical protein VKN64_07680 [Halanaerobiales bacterium]|nr:hypothetical protein [Halanaerobiales bacterium]